jgi:hypothetical protein
MAVVLLAGIIGDTTFYGLQGFQTMSVGDVTIISGSTSVGGTKLLDADALFGERLNI